MLRETLFVLDQHPFFVLTLSDGDEHEPSIRDLGFAYAFAISESGEREDCLVLVSEPLAPDRNKAEELERSAEGQLDVAAMHVGKKLHATYIENAAKYCWQAQQAMLDSRLLPRNAWHLGGRRLLLEYKSHRGPRWYRVVCCATRTELERFADRDLDEALQNRYLKTSGPKRSVADLERLVHGLGRGATDPSAHTALINELQTAISVVQESMPRDTRASKLKVIGAREDMLIVHSGLDCCLLQRTAKGLRRVSTHASLHGSWPVAAATDSGFIFEVRPLPESSATVCIDDAGHEVQRWERKKGPIARVTGTQPTSNFVVYASFGGECTVLDGSTGAVDRIPEFLGLGKDDLADVRVSPSGRFVAAFEWRDANKIGLFDRQTRVCAVLRHSGTEVFKATSSGAAEQWRVPGIELLDDHLIIVAAGEIRRLPLIAMPWASPPAPPPKFKKFKEPLATIEAATKSGPLAPIGAFVRGLFAPSICLTASKQREDLPSSCTKFNGLPDLAAGADWPRWRGTPMAFMAQIDLAEAHGLASDLSLPATGLLSFFLGLDPGYPLPSFFSEVNEDREGVKVLWTPPGSEMRRLLEPEDMPAEFKCMKRPVCKIKMSRAGAVLPQLSHSALINAQLTPDQAHAYESLANLLNGDDEDAKHWGTRLGGYPAVLQDDDMHLTAESLERDIGVGSKRYLAWQSDDFQRASTRWRQLLQMAEGEEEWSWGDAGMLHWMARADEFANANFSSVWAIGVCH